MPDLIHQDVEPSEYDGVAFHYHVAYDVADWGIWPFRKRQVDIHTRTWYYVKELQYSNLASVCFTFDKGIYKAISRHNKMLEDDEPAIPVTLIAPVDLPQWLTRWRYYLVNNEEKMEQLNFLISKFGERP